MTNVHSNRTPPMMKAKRMALLMFIVAFPNHHGLGLDNNLNSSSPSFNSKKGVAGFVMGWTIHIRRRRQERSGRAVQG